MNPRAKRDSLSVKSLQTSYQIIESLVALEGATVSEIAEVTNIAKTTVHDHLTTLRQLGYVIQEDECYKISMHFLRLGERARQDMDLYKTSQPELFKLANETGEYASLVVEEQGEGIMIATERGKAAVPIGVYNGIRMPLHTTASCKAILAHLPKERVHEIIEQRGLEDITPYTITDQDELFIELEEIRSQGYALGHEERVTGFRTIGVPIIDRSDRVRGSIAVWGPTNRIGDERFNTEIPQLLKESANIIEIQLNY